MRASAARTKGSVHAGAGARLDVVSRHLGHASAAFTADIYSHDEDEAASHAAELVGGILGE